MATATTTLAPISDSDANFRLWGKWISDTLAALGWVKTADSGQINWATVTKPGAGTTSQGYEIWRMADSLQATKPVFVKIEYGSGGSATYPSLWITVGSATDGAGTITGAATTRQQIAAVGAASTLYSCYASGTTSRFTLAMFSTSASVSYYLILSIERSRDAAGAETGTAVQVALIGSSTSTSRQQWLEIGVSASTQEVSLGCLLPSFGTLSKGSIVQLAPVFLCDGNFQNPLLGLVVGFTSNLSINASLSFTMYGSSRTYLPVQSYVTNRSAVAAGSLLAVILYE